MFNVHSLLKGGCVDVSYILLVYVFIMFYF
jgi:hypothetical protein